MINIKRNVSLKKHNTFNIDSKAKYFIEIKSADELRGAVGFAKTNELPILIIGQGSNILMADRIFNGLVIRINNDETKIVEETKDYVYIKAGAGNIWDDLVKKAVENSWQGVECLSGIPGTVGAAPIQNIGAYGQELSDVFVELVAYDLRKRKFVTLDADSCKFGYRDSMFKKKGNNDRYIIFDVTLKLYKSRAPRLTYTSLIKHFRNKKVSNPTLKQIRNAVLVIRKQKLEDPKEHGNAGSFFKNPIISKEKYERLRSSLPDIPSYPEKMGKVKLSAGWLIEKAGWKGKIFKNVGVSEKHALTITNATGEGTAKEILELASNINNDIKQKYNIDLEIEVQVIG